MVRPTIFTEELANEIISRFAGGETVLQICADERTPHRSTVYQWLASEEPAFAAFQKSWRVAQKAHAMALADETLEIADDTSNDTIIKTSKSGEDYEAPNNEYIARSRLRVETRFKLMGKRAPELFGEHMQLSGPGGEPIQITDPNGRDIARRIALTLALGLANANKIAQAKLIEGDADAA